jgi:hypothetical protein
MTETRQTETEFVELTMVMLQAALNMTSSPDHYTDKTKAFVQALHKGSFNSTNRWTVELDESGMESLAYMLDVYCLNRGPNIRTRFRNYLRKNSELYREMVARQAKEAKAS